MIYRRKPDTLSDKRPVLDAMGRCRKVLLDESDKVVPFGPTYKALQLVVTAIDGLAKFFGKPDYYSAGGSTPGSEDSKWRDWGTGS